MQKIALITERLSGKSLKNGAVMRDERLLSSLRLIFDVDVIYNSEAKGSRWDIFKSYKDVSDDVRLALESKIYRYIIVSSFPVSPCYLTYASINPNVIYYLCDSMFHIRSQYLDLKTKLLSVLLAMKERKLLKTSYASYLGQDEINTLPDKFKHKGLIFPFSIENANNLFDNNGFITFVGDYSFLPNMKALLTIIEISKLTDVKFKLFGGNLPDGVYMPHNVKYCGYVDNLSTVYDGAKALIYPLKYGTGVKNKVIEAMSYGIPVLGYKEAFTNISLCEELNKCIVEDLTDFKTLIEGDLNDMSSSVIDLITTNFSPQSNADIIFQQIVKTDNRL
jgi:glycosyltransferase involved in cell wall biosynthesis